MTIIDNFNKIEDEVKKTADACGRNHNEIKIMAVSKTFSAGDIQEAINSGIRLFGENRIQEAKLKIPQLSGESEFHLIGQLQSNKCKEAVKFFKMIHSIEKLSTAEVLNKEANKINKIQEILIQVKTSSELSKSGAAPDEIIDLAGDILNLENISIKGIMTVAPFTDNKSEIKESFLKAKSVLNDINKHHSTDFKELSMGMSNDFKIAIEAGSTIVRVGSAIFGNR